MQDKNALLKTQELYRDGQERLVRDKAFELGVKYYDARKIETPTDTLAVMSKEEIEKYKTVPVYFKTGHLVLGSLNPQDEALLSFIETIKKNFKNIELSLISEPSYTEILNAYVEKGVKKFEFNKREDIVELDVKITSFFELDKQLKDAPIQDLLKMIMFTAVNSKASDVHVEPQEENTLIRFRIDGVLHEVARLEKERYRILLSQIELKSGIKLGANYAQKGRFEVVSAEGNLSLRVETLPSLFGDDIVIRIFNTKANMLTIEDLGILEDKAFVLKEALARPHGMIMVVGPTGSGKTSTIYAVLNKLNTSEIKIVTLEDPIEYTLKGAVQSQINEGESFADRLKAVLREDPDVIMVGEIRDSETAKTAMQAALTGHLVITTIHANNAITAITRMTELEGDPATLTAATNLMIAQRLVRKICDSCKEEYEPTEIESKEIDRILATFPDDERPKVESKFYVGKGCEACGNIGYKGRIGIFEFLSITKELQQAIIERKAIFQLQEIAIQNGMMTMEQDGLLKAINGTTSISEVMRAIKE